MLIRNLTSSSPAITILPKPKNIKLRVLNTTATAGLAKKVDSEFTSFGFVSAGSGNASLIERNEIHYNTKSKAKAELVAKYVDATLILDNQIKDADVVLYLGTNYKNLIDPKAPTTTTSTLPTSKVKNTTPTNDVVGNDPSLECKA